ncbi:zinc finger protein 121-like [Nematolebias whitei]|uniref:zinc finger protein 121-like n=1 Tax=Nematolebias whitei TaxID=451745 RepID=UPI00189A5FCE|nr:zinc finger protein 121-like [Nematolebias whitei]
MSEFLDKTGPDHEEERSRLKEKMQENKILDAVWNPRARLHTLVFPVDVQHTVLIKEEAPEEWSSGVDQKDPETLNIKEEEEEPRISLEVEQFGVKEETDDTRAGSYHIVHYNTVPLKSEDDEEKPLFSQLHQHQVEDGDLPTSSSADQMKAATGGEDCVQRCSLDAQQMMLIVEEGSEEWRFDVDQKDSETLYMKLHQHKVEDEDLPTISSADQMKASTVGEDCGRAGTIRNSDLNIHEDDSSSSETEDSEDDDEDVNDPDSQLKDSSDFGSEPEDHDKDWAPESSVNNVNKSCNFTECEKQFLHKESVQRQKTGHSRIKSSSFLVSKNCFRVKKTGGSNKNIHPSQKPFNCDDCGKRFNRKVNLNRHMLIHTGQKPFACDVCGQRFGHKSTVNTHMRIHTEQKPFACDVCGQRFRQKSHLKTHMRIHTGQKPFPCDVCGHKFREKSALNIHERIHTGQKPFACEVCGQSFRVKSRLNMHMRIHTGQKPFPCDVCGHKFRDKSTLKRHIRIHTGQKPFACDVCGHRFGRKSHLNMHMRIHTGQKPFPCDVCGHKFRDKSTLNMHMRNHTGQKSFACDVCGQKFGYKSHLNQHMRIHTGGENSSVLNIKTVSKDT